MVFEVLTLNALNSPVNSQYCFRHFGRTIGKGDCRKPLCLGGVIQVHFAYRDIEFAFNNIGIEL